MTDLPLLRLLQLTSPALPIGAFAYSQGLESAVSLGWVTDEATATDWIRGLLTVPFARLDLPMLVRMLDAWKLGDANAVRRKSRLLLAYRDSRELELEDLHFGHALARVLVGHGVETARDWVAFDGATGPAMFSLACAAWQIPARAALLGYAYTFAEAQTGALSRLLPLGQIAIQRILAAVLAAAPEAAETALSVADDDFGSLAPSHALASMLHETEYSRLFRS